MANARRKLNEAPPNLYEQQRLANIADNKRKMDALITPALSNMQQQQGQPKKRTKRIHNTSGAATEGHNLRPRPQRNVSENANEQIDPDIGCESIGDFLCDNEDFHAPQKKRKGRGITKLEDIFARESDMPKIKIQLNQFGQPVGNNSRKFSSAVGCYVRKKLSVSSVDWRLVDGEKKFEVWTDLKKIYDIDDAAFNWFLSTAGKKWKEFKSTLKEQYFNENLTDVDLKDKHRGRVNDEDWKFLSEYWMSPECEEKTRKAKFSHSQVGSLHTSGSKSFARSGHEMSNELGHPPRRDELYIKTHTRKNGVPTKHAEPVINKLKEFVEAHPELKERTIQQGDAFAAVCGEKEPRGRVRVLGLGPTPQDIGTPGMRSYTPTRLQMEVLARKKAEREKATLEQRISEMEEKMQEQRMAREMRNVEIISQNGSNTQHHLVTRSGEHVDETHNIAQFHEDEAYAEDQSSDEGENLLGGRCVSSPAMQSCQGNLVSATPAAHPSQGNPINATRALQPSGNPNNATPAVQLSQGNPTNGTPAMQPSQGNPINATLAVQPCQGNTVRAAPAIPPLHDELIGKDVILYAMLRDQPVAKGTIISTNPSTVLGGVALGKQYCEVVVNVVLKRDVVLPRPYEYMEKMGDADRMSIAWPYKRLKVCKTSKSSQSATGGRS